MLLDWERRKPLWASERQNKSIPRLRSPRGEKQRQRAAHIAKNRLCLQRQFSISCCFSSFCLFSSSSSMMTRLTSSCSRADMKNFPRIVIYLLWWRKTLSAEVSYLKFSWIRFDKERQISCVTHPSNETERHQTTWCDDDDDDDEEWTSYIHLRHSMHWKLVKRQRVDFEPFRWLAGIHWFSKQCSFLCPHRTWTSIIWTYRHIDGTHICVQGWLEC